MTARPVIIDTRIGNFGSIAMALRRAGAESVVASDAAALADATHIILPGVGSFDSAIQAIDAQGLRDALSRRVLEDGVPTLGICLGMQLLGASSEEGRLGGLGWLAGRTVRFHRPEGMRDFHVPHIGWNGIAARNGSALLDGMNGTARFYFVHSYHYCDGPDPETVATAEYGYEFCAIVQRGNIVGTQFHPERSGPDGHRLIANFLRMAPRV
jgi:glutamine amidotransferase